MQHEVLFYVVEGRIHVVLPLEEVVPSDVHVSYCAWTVNHPEISYIIV